MAKTLWLIGCFVVLACTGVFVYFSTQSAGTINITKDQLLADVVAMDHCQVSTITTLKPEEKNNVFFLVNVSQYCFSNAVRRAQLVDFTINRTVFAEQNYENHILLWMVVAITISGVALSAVQLFSAYRLAEAAKLAVLPDMGGGIDVDSSGKLSFKSSVTGLMILVVSLAFFIVFVNSIYSLTDRFLDPAECAASDSEKKTLNAALPPAVGASSVKSFAGSEPKMLPTGGIGQPPASAPPASKKGG
jgi:hypothetical protein